MRVGISPLGNGTVTTLFLPHHLAPQAQDRLYVYLYACVSFKSAFKTFNKTAESCMTNML